ncbi:MAG: GxxExxY protein [Muribaculaceae bacterium]|nr:GxxExxY protein [Muribaculaceae bacterium]MDE6521444.1 GxxExxY protein [Muribaculaceae bacterium]
MNMEELIKTVIDGCYKVHEAFEAGYLESVYKKALIIELQSRSLNVQEEVELRVTYKGHEVGFFKADIIVEGCLIIELKAVSNITVQHELQLVNYLCCTGIDDGLLVNFGSDRLQIKRKYRQYKPRI